MKTYIHDITMFVPLLKGAISNVEQYVGRALLAPEGVVVYKNPQVQPYVDYLNSFNLGPKKVWEVEQNGPTLFHSVDKSQQKEEILELSDMIIPFVSWGETNKFKDKWGLDDSQWGTQPEKVHRELENKVNLRSDFPDRWFVDYEVCDSLKEIQKSAEEMLQKYSAVIVRHPKMASGIGSKLIADNEELYTGEFEKFVQSYSDKKMLVEEFVKQGEEYSVTWNIDSDKKPQLLYWSKQYIKNRIHQGNVVADAEDVFEDEQNQTVKEISEATEKIVENYLYPGRIGFDLIIRPDNSWKILESNCRYGGSSYPNFIREQVSSDRCVLMHNIKPDLSDFQDVHKELEKLGIDYESSSQAGCFVANPFCLPDKCAVVIVSESVDEGENMLKKVLRHFE